MGAEAFKRLRGMRSHDAIRDLKTWTNGWCTSDRFHASVRLPCLFGCIDAVDKQAHYCMCPNLFTILSYLWQPVEDISSDPICRLGLQGTSIIRLKAVACTFSAYHHIKFNHAARFGAHGDLSPTQPLTRDVQFALLGSFAEVFRTEAFELGCHARCFDPDDYEAFASSLSAISEASI